MLLVVFFVIVVAVATAVVVDVVFVFLIIVIIINSQKSTDGQYRMKSWKGGWLRGGNDTIDNDGKIRVGWTIKF